MASRSAQNNKMNSKIMMAVVVLAIFVAGYFVARSRYKPQIRELNKMVQEKAQEVDKVKLSSNKVMMKDGKIWLVEKGVATELDANLMFSNGDKVMLDGVIVRADGTEEMMEEGQTIDMNGKIVEDSN